MQDDQAIIFHHFDQSPFSEKIRVVFGFKRLTWTSVQISRVMPRPDLMPLTGGYRRTPTMQIGADIYCDTQIIIRELETRFPEPTLFPAGYSGLPWALGMWSDRTFFLNTVNLSLGSLADKIPQDFIADRERLFGAKFDFAALRAAIPHLRDQFRAHVDWIERELDGPKDWLLGDFSLADVHAYLNIWFARGRFTDIDHMLEGFRRVLRWERRIQTLGHGFRQEMSSADALNVARQATPRSPTFADPDDPNGRKPGDRVSVAPDDYGKIAVHGEIVSLSAQHIAIRRHDDVAGDIVVHFPRAGFVVASA